MPTFKLHCKSPATGEVNILAYDPYLSTLFNETTQTKVIADAATTVQMNTPKGVSIDHPVVGKRRLARVKIQLGLLCNFSCEYCVQKAVPVEKESSKNKLDDFLASFDTWYDGGLYGDGSGTRIEFWGGEPFAYWKTLKPLAEEIRRRYPKVEFVTITNGSLFDEEKLAWLKAMNFSMGVSHDGPGQSVRGPDPLDDPAMLALWVKAKEMFGERISFNSILNNKNTSRSAIEKWFKERLGDDVILGEGELVVSYSEESANTAQFSAKELQEYARRAFMEMRNHEVDNFQIVRSRIFDFIDSIKSGRPLSDVGQKCKMDRPDQLAVDLSGNVLTCQNVSSISTAQNGKPHKLGHVSDLSEVVLDTSTHFSHRASCMSCPVVQLCKGSCMFNEGELFELSCRTSYFDNIAFLATAIESLTGMMLVYIEASWLPAERRDPFGFLGIKVDEVKPKRFIPIKAI